MMERREFMKAGLAAGALAAFPTTARASGGAPDDRRYYEMRVYEMRSDIGPNRLRNFFRDALVPALRRLGAGPVGGFLPEAGMLGQSVTLVFEHASAADALTLDRRLAADSAYAAALHTLENDAQLPYVRYESRLMRAFGGHPRLEVPPGDASRPARLFELRTYESRSLETLARKIDMFDVAEIALFRSIGMLPVFFGENVYGTRLPSLTYMIAFDDLAARAKAWATFRTHPEWRRISTDPRWAAEGGITSVTSAVLLNPLGFSTIR